MSGLGEVVRMGTGHGHIKLPSTWVHCSLALPEAGTKPYRLLEQDQFVLFMINEIM